MKKIDYLIILAVFVFTTIYVYVADSGVSKKRIYLLNRAMYLTQDNAQLVSEKSSFEFKQKTLPNQKKKKDNSFSVNDINKKPKKRSEKIETSDIEVKTKKEKTKNFIDEFIFSSVNWNNWRSNFLNKILDDSDSIPTLNYYKPGSWLYFTFKVTNTGEIKNIHIFSIHLTDLDKKDFEKLIASYAHKDITKFPPNSKRKSVRVKALFTLDNNEKRAKPEDFFDTEKVRGNN